MVVSPAPLTKPVGALQFRERRRAPAFTARPFFAAGLQKPALAHFPHETDYGSARRRSFRRNSSKNRVGAVAANTGDVNRAPQGADTQASGRGQRRRHSQPLAEAASGDAPAGAASGPVDGPHLSAGCPDPGVQRRRASVRGDDGTPARARDATRARDAAGARDAARGRAGRPGGGPGSVGAVGEVSTGCAGPLGPSRRHRCRTRGGQPGHVERGASGKRM